MDHAQRYVTASSNNPDDVPIHMQLLEAAYQMEYARQRERACTANRLSRTTELEPAGALAVVTPSPIASLAVPVRDGASRAWA
jgi:hypothetical protein